MGKEKTTSKEATAKELKTFVSDAKKSPNFAFAMASGEGSPVLLHSRTKKPDQLASMAKKAANSTKVAFGVARADGANIFFTLDDAAPTGLLKAIREHFKDHGVTAKALLVTKSGFIEGMEDDPPTEGTDRRGEFVKAFSDVTAKLIPGFASDGGLKSAAEDLIARMQKLQEAPNFDESAASLLVKAAKTLLEQHLEREAKRLREAFSKAISDMKDKRLGKRVQLNPGFAKKLEDLGVLAEKAVNSVPPDVPALEKILKAALLLTGTEGAPSERQGKAETSTDREDKPTDPLGRISEAWNQAYSTILVRAEVQTQLGAQVKKFAFAYEGLLKQTPPDLGMLAKLVQQVQALLPSPENVKDPEVKGFAEAHDIWDKAAQAAFVDLGRLRQVILTEMEGMDAAREVTVALDNLAKKVEQVRQALANAVLLGTRTGDGDERRKQSLRVDKLAHQVGQMLKSDDVLSRIDTNPFVEVKIAANLGTAIQMMLQRLAA